MSWLIKIVGLRRQPWLRWWALGLVAAWTGCQTQNHLVLDRVGPSSVGMPGTPLSKIALIGSGYLVVHSATETRYAGKSLIYYPHTAYIIETDEGKRVRWVQNAVG